MTGMEILLNGEATPVPEGITINALLIHIGLGERRVAVEVNREVVPRSRHPQHRLNDRDRVEIVHAIGGG
jgi:sulfur carrier protein